MKKRIIGVTVAVILLLNLIAIPVFAESISLATFNSRIDSLRKYTNVTQIYNSTYSGDGSRCYKDLDGAVSWECAAWSLFAWDSVWKQGAKNNRTIHRDANSLCAGDYVRFRNGSSYDHSIFVTKISGDTVYYTDGNGDGRNTVAFDKKITKSALQTKINTALLWNLNKFGITKGSKGFIVHYNGNDLGSGANTTVSPIHTNTNANVRNGFFTFKNVSSGKFMNVNSGKDANKTPIDMWAYDDSTDQQFNIVHKGNGKYKLYAYCSGAGTNRVVDVYRNGAAPAAGQPIDLWTPDDDTAQLFYIVPLSDGSFVFELAAKDGYVIAPNSASAANTNGAQLTLQLYTGASYQKWKLCNNNGGETYALGSYSADSYKVNTNGVTLIMRSGAGTGYSKVTSIPDGTVLNVTQVSSNWGYTTYNGNKGWICLDFTIYSPTVSSISVYSKPYIEKFFVGEKLDTDGLELEVTYSNGSKGIVSTGYTTEYDFSSVGEKTVIVNYSGKSTSFSITVAAAATADLSIEAVPTAYCGNEVTAIIKLDNAQDVYDGNFNLQYDNAVLSFESYTIGGTLNNCSVIVNDEYGADKIRISFAGTVALNNGTMLEVVFKVISDKVNSTCLEIDALNMYNASGNSATSTANNFDVSILKYDYTIVNHYILDTNDKETDTIPATGSFYVGLNLNKNTEGTSRPCVVYAVYDNKGRLITFTVEENRYSQGDGLNCETLIALPADCEEPSYIKCFIWDNMNDMKSLSGNYLIQ